ncbi:Uncharacterised protein [Mycobacteroides abscessus subsp. abscessus]|nr:Uncharacterised protein [Mycobacteroides abscessus subsp. abscessus]
MTFLVLGLYLPKPRFECRTCLVKARFCILEVRLLTLMFTFSLIENPLCGIKLYFRVLKSQLVWFVTGFCRSKFIYQLASLVYVSL